MRERTGPRCAGYTYHGLESDIGIDDIFPVEVTLLPLSADAAATARTSGCLIVNDYNSSTGKEAVSIIPEMTNVGISARLD